MILRIRVTLTLMVYWKRRAIRIGHGAIYIELEGIEIDISIQN